MQKCAPTFGAVPSAKDLKKKEEEQVEAEEKRDEILAKFMQKDAIDRVNKLEMSEPAKVCDGSPLQLQKHAFLTTLTHVV